MKLLNAPIEIARGLVARHVPKPEVKPTSSAPKQYTLSLESGVVHINNVTGQREGLTYTILAEDEQGNSKILKRTIKLEAYQTHSDRADGLRPVAVWSSN